MGKSIRATLSRALLLGMAAGAALLGSSLSFAAQATSFATSTEVHNHQPGGWLDYTISAVGAVIVAVVIFFTIKWFLHPRETEHDHIKRKILEEHA